MKYIKSFLEAWNDDHQDISVLFGKTLKDVIVNGEESIKFIVDDGSEYLMYHDHECSEQVFIDDIAGDVEDLIGSPITLSEKSDSEHFLKHLSDPKFDGPKGDGGGDEDAWEWTFYRFATIKGYVNIRWYGCSNGYYSTAVSFIKTK